MNSRQLASSAKQLRIMTALLVIQFILGVTLTTLIDYSPSKHSAVQMTFLVLHIFVAIGILILAAFRLLTAVKWHSLLVHSIVGFLAILMSMIAGSFAATYGNDVAVFFMAMGFLIAFGAYGYSMGAISRRFASNKS